jgi:hypothetical protein
MKQIRIYGFFILSLTVFFIGTSFDASTYSCTGPGMYCRVAHPSNMACIMMAPPTSCGPGYECCYDGFPPPMH